MAVLLFSFLFVCLFFVYIYTIILFILTLHLIFVFRATLYHSVQELQMKKIAKKKN